MNCAEYVTSPSGGEVAGASDGFETTEAVTPTALADKQQ